MKPESYYSPGADLVVIHVRHSTRVCSEERPWGLLDCDAETNELASLEIWNASKALPAEVLDVMPELDRSNTMVQREDLAKHPPA